MLAFGIFPMSHRRSWCAQPVLSLSMGSLATFRRARMVWTGFYFLTAHAAKCTVPPPLLRNKPIQLFSGWRNGNFCSIANQHCYPPSMSAVSSP